MKLDLKDRKILFELDLNSRQSNKEIAKKIGLSKDSVYYRTKQLEEKGIIKQYHTVIDVGKLGFISYRLYLKLQNASPKKEQELINYLKNHPLVGWLVSIDGEYDLGCWILTKKIKEMNQFWKELLEKYLDIISLRQLTTFTRVKYFPRTYLLELQTNSDEQIFITEPQETYLDQKDLYILSLLAPNARKPLIEIAQEVNLTPKTVTTKIRDLEKRKVIIGYRTVFDLEKLGFQYFKVNFQLSSRPRNSLLRLREFIRAHPNIIFDNEVLGGDDIEIEIQVKTLPELRNIIASIKKEFSEIIKDDKHLLFYKEHKFTFLPNIISNK